MAKKKNSIKEFLLGYENYFDLDYWGGKGRSPRWFIIGFSLIVLLWFAKDLWTIGADPSIIAGEITIILFILVIILIVIARYKEVSKPKKKKL